MPPTAAPPPAFAPRFDTLTRRDALQAVAAVVGLAVAAKFAGPARAAIRTFGATIRATPVVRPTRNACGRPCGRLPS